VNSFSNVAAIAEKEWRHYFGSPIAYVALFVWTLLFGGFFFILFQHFVMVSMQSGAGEFGPGPKMSLNEWVFSGVLHNMSVVALFLTPMITMRLYAEESRQGTIELLATSPITNLEIIVGKFLSALGLYALMIVVGFVNFALVWSYATVKPEWRPLATGSLALLLIGAAFIAVGLFISTLTKNQIVAGTLTFGVLLGFWILGWWDDPSGGAFARVLGYLGLVSHIDDLVKGVIDLKDIVFYLSFVAFGIFLAHQSVESQRWRA
jgi:ABC-2 type transport system permease protein